MTKGFNRVGSGIGSDHVRIDIEEAERIRNIGTDLMFCEKSTKHIGETAISASLVASNMLGIHNYRPLDVANVYGYVEDESLGDDSWHLLLKYNSYKDLDGGLLGLESSYEVSVIDGSVAVALCGLYHLRDTRDIKVRGNEIKIEQMEKRTMTEIPLTSERIDNLDEKIRRLIGRVKSNA